MKKDDACKALGTMINTATQLLMKKVAEETNNDGPSITKVAMQACLAALTSACFALGKKNGKTPEELAQSCTTPETMTFAALMAASQMQDGPPNSINDNELALVASFGPEQFGLALEGWQKLFPDKKIEDYVEAEVAVVARNAIAASDKPFAEFMKNRGGYMLPNNGSVN